jgi:hypothetical protein
MADHTLGQAFLRTTPQMHPQGRGIVDIRGVVRKTADNGRVPTSIRN